MAAGESEGATPAKQKITAASHTKTLENSKGAIVNRSYAVNSRLFALLAQPLPPLSSLYILSIDRSDHTSPKRADTVSAPHRPRPTIEAGLQNSLS